MTSDVRSKKNATEEGKVALKAKYQVPRNSPLITPKSETRSEISVKFGIYKVKVKKNSCPLFTSPIHRGDVNSGRIYIYRGGKQRTLIFLTPPLYTQFST